jgi:hypothetical protein
MWRIYCGEWSRLLTSYVGLLPCASTIRKAATVIIITAAKGEAQQIIKGRGARASFMTHPLYIHSFQQYIWRGVFYAFRADHIKGDSSRIRQVSQCVSEFTSQSVIGWRNSISVVSAVSELCVITTASVITTGWNRFRRLVWSACRSAIIVICNYNLWVSNKSMIHLIRNLQLVTKPIDVTVLFQCGRHKSLC